MIIGLLIITILVTCVILYTCKLHFETLIKEAADTEVTNSYRKKYKIVRYIVVIPLLFILFYLFYSDSITANGLTNGILLLGSGLIAKLMLPVSFKTVKDLHPNEQFILYLRGFNTDCYVDYRSLSQNTQFKKFSEFHFINYLNKYFPVYAVGMTKELSSPHGATRLYLNDLEWQEDVQTLITSAELVFILVNDSDSCIWEIEQSIPNSKTYYIIDDINKLDIVKSTMLQKKNNIFSIINKPNVVASKKKNSQLEIIAEYENTEESYHIVIRQIMKDVFGMKRWIVTPAQYKILLYTFVIVTISLVYLLNISSVSQMIPISIVVSLLIFPLVFLYCAPLSKWRHYKKL